MAEVDSLTIRINAETGSAVAQLKQLTQLVERLNTAANQDGWKNFTKGFSKMGKAADNVAKFANQLNNAISDKTLERLERIGAAMAQISSAAGAAGRAVRSMEKASQKNSESSRAKSLAKSWQNVIKVIEAVNKGLSQIGRDLYGAFSSTGITDDLDRISSAVSKNIPILGELTSAWKSAASQIKNIVLSNASIVDKAANVVLVRVSTIIRMLYSLAKLPISSMGLTKNLMKGFVVPLKNFASAVADAKKKWDKFLSSLARVAVYRLIRSALKEIAKALKEGVNNLYMWGMAWQNTYSSAAKFVETMDRLATAFLYLKNSIGAAVSPLIDAVAPVIDSLIDKFVELINVVNEAMAALSGAAFWRRAIKYQYTYAEAANLSAKALKRTVLAFDELNKLDDPNKGSSKNQPDYSKMFEEVPVDSWISKILESSSWRLLGTGIANKINEALASINWNKVNSTVRIWARRLGSLFDGLLMGINMPLFGKSVAEGLNTIARAINTFFKEFHFVELGKNLADGFVSMIHNMSWAEIGEALTQKWKAAFELVIGFKDVDLSGLGKGIVEMISSAIDNIPISDFVDALETLAPKLGTEIGIVLNGIFTKTNEVMDGLDAEGFGTSLTTALDNMVKEIKPEEAGKFLTNGIKKIIEFSTGALKNESFWTDLNEWLGNLVTNMFKNIDLKTGVQNAIDFAQKIVNLLTTAINSVPWEEVGDAISSADTSGLKEGFKKLFESVTDGLERAGFMDEVAGGIAAYLGLKLVGALVKLLPTILSAKAIASAGGGAAVASGAASVAAYIGGSLVAALAAWFGGMEIGKMIGKWMFPEDASYYDNFSWFGEGGFFEALLDEAKFEWEDYKTQIQTGWDVIKDAFTSARDTLSGVMDTLKQKMDSLSSSWSSGASTILDGLAALTGADISVIDKITKPGKSTRTNTGKLVRRASGGMVDKGDLFLAGENGPEIVTSFGGESAVMNMDQIISTISQSVSVAGGGDITIPISLDGGLLDKVIVTAQQRQSLRSGR